MAIKQQFFIKTFDERVAKVLIDGGFSYTQENVTAVDKAGNRVDRTVYSFAYSRKLRREITRLAKAGQCNGCTFLYDPMLRF